MAGNGSFKTPEQPQRVMKRTIEPSPNLNLVLQGLPDLTPPRKQRVSDVFPAGASPSATEFGGFSRAVESSPGGFRGPDGKADSAFDIMSFRSPLKGQSPMLNLASPRSAGGGGMNPPPVPIFHPSPRRASDASTYLSPDSRSRRSSLAGSEPGGSGAAPGTAAAAAAAGGFSFPPAPSPAPGSGTYTSVFATILGDGHSRISPAHLSAAAAAARGGGQSHFGGIFASASAAGTDASGRTASGTGGAGALIPLDGMGHTGSPMQLSRPIAGGAHIDINGDAHGAQHSPHGGAAANDDDDGGYDAAAARRPSRRRALNFDDAVAMGVTVGSASPGGLGMPGPGPLSPTPAPGVLEPLEALLPIAQLRDGSSGDEGSGEGAMQMNGVKMEGGVPGAPAPPPAGQAASVMDASALSLAASARSPVSMRPGIMRREDIIDSPGVKEAAALAINAALVANRNAAGRGDPLRRASDGRRPARAAAAGAAAAAAAAVGGGGPLARRPSGAHAFGSGPGVSADGGMFAPIALPGMAAGVTATVRCNCKKSRCMKLYCDCFKAQGYCGEGCSCVGCSNREDNAPAVNAARDTIAARNPHAFAEKIAAANGGDRAGDGTGAGAVQHRRGCNCKKSKCLKKYCECFQAGIPCGDACKCDGCHNTQEAVAAGRVPYSKNAVAARAARALNEAKAVAEAKAAGGGGASREHAMPAAQAAVAAATAGNGSQDSGELPGEAAVKGGNGGAAAAAAPAAQPAFAALGPAFQQILLQRAMGGGGPSGTATAAAPNGAGNPAATPAAGTAAPPQPPGTVTINNQVLVPIHWPLPGGPGVSPAAAQQFLSQLAAAGALQGPMAAAAAAAMAAAQQAAQGPNVPPAAGAAGIGSQEATDGSGSGGSPPQAVALADSGVAVAESKRRGKGGVSRRKARAPVASDSGAAAGETSGGSGSGDDGAGAAKPRTTPTKRKPVRTMTAALM